MSACGVFPNEGNCMGPVSEPAIDPCIPLDCPAPPADKPCMVGYG